MRLRNQQAPPNNADSYMIYMLLVTIMEVLMVAITQLFARILLRKSGMNSMIAKCPKWAIH